MLKPVMLIHSGYSASGIDCACMHTRVCVFVCVKNGGLEEANVVHWAAFSLLGTHLSVPSHCSNCSGEGVSCVAPASSGAGGPH